MTKGERRVLAALDQFDFCRVRIDLNDTVRVTQEFDGHGNHRLVVGNLWSDWVGYHRISRLEVHAHSQHGQPGGIYCGTSEYYGNTLPRVFQLINCFNSA